MGPWLIGIHNYIHNVSKKRSLLLDSMFTDPPIPFFWRKIECKIFCKTAHFLKKQKNKWKLGEQLTRNTEKTCPQTDSPREVTILVFCGLRSLLGEQKQLKSGSFLSFWVHAYIHLVYLFAVHLTKDLFMRIPFRHC